LSNPRRDVSKAERTDWWPKCPIRIAARRTGDAGGATGWPRGQDVQ
jgi:hypothetical protein